MGEEGFREGEKNIGKEKIKAVGVLGRVLAGREEREGVGREESNFIVNCEEMKDAKRG